MDMQYCESEFDHEDKNHRGFSMTEIDIYGWISRDKSMEHGIKCHRLSIVKNLTTDEYVLYRNFVGSKDDYEMGDIVAKDRSLQVIFNKAREEWNRFHATPT